jgi:hypothetical protein
MRLSHLIVALTLGGSFAAGGVLAATADQEAQFVAAYKSAFAAKDKDALSALLYTQGVDPVALQFYKEMMGAEVTDGTLVSAELLPLSADEAAAAAEVQDGPTGKIKLAPKPYKKLVAKVSSKTGDSSSESTDTVFVAEIDGKIVIATPAPAN